MSDSTTVTPVAYPQAILQGDVVRTAFEGVRARLRSLFPETIFTHHVLPPQATKNTWQEITRNPPAVGVGIGQWEAPHSPSSAGFIGDLRFPVAVIQQLDNSDQLYLGTGELRGIGLAGIMAALVGAMHNWKLDGVGSCQVRRVTYPETVDWFGDRSALVAADLVFPNVALDNAQTLGELDEFLRYQLDLQVENKP